MKAKSAGNAHHNIRQPDAAWLAKVLGTDLAINDIKEIGSNRGFLSTTWRLLINATPADSAPASIVLKSQSSNPLFMRLASERRSFDREIAFYRDLAPRAPVRLPQVFATGDADDPWLLMEDLTELRAGDQVRGLSQNDVRAVVRQIAKLHAIFWQDESIIKTPWLPANTFWFSEVDLSIVNPFIQEHGLRIGDNMVTVLTTVINHLPRIDHLLADRPFTLIHGDLRADNLLFDDTDDQPEALILDWQTSCRSVGAIDLAYLIGGSEPEAERSSHIAELLYLWHGELVANGVRNYSISDAKQDFQLASLRCLAAALRLYSTLHHESTSVRGALFRTESIERYFDLAERIEAWTALSLLDIDLDAL
jgi:Ser/Thr protein kinase RdoA (MazF antagonist)